MYFRKKISGGRAYLQIVESRQHPYGYFHSSLGTPPNPNFSHKGLMQKRLSGHGKKFTVVQRPFFRP